MTPVTPVPKILTQKHNHLFSDLTPHYFQIYAILFTSGSSLFEEGSADGTTLHQALRCGLEAIMKYGHAKPGHRTMVDPLNAAIAAVADPKTKDDWKKIVEASEKTANETSKMEAKSGRASYTSASQQIQPDPGAIAVATWMKAAFETFYEY